MPGRLSLILLALLLVLTACTHQELKAPPRPGAQLIYDQGKAALREKDYPLAADRFRAVGVYYPGTPLAIQSRLELAYTYYKSGDFISALAAANRFIRNHPDNAHLDYLYYLRGLAAFQQSIDALAEQQNTEAPREVHQADLSLRYFNALLQRFPTSRYREDSHQRMVILRTRLAENELQLAKHALETKRYATAALHARAVIENHAAPPLREEARTMASMAYHMLKLAPPPAAGSRLPTPHPEITPTAQAQASPRAATPAPDSSPPKPASPAASALPHREAWLLRQPATRYSLQLLGTRSEQALRAFIHRYHLTAQAAYFQTHRNGTAWFTLLYGSYPDALAARDAAAGLAEKLRPPRPWVRKLGDIQHIIRKDRK